MESSSSHPRHGGNLVWAATLAGCSPTAILDFSASINPLGPPQSALDALQASIDDLRNYPDPDYRALRQALSQHHGLPIEWILPGNGAAELLTWASRELADLPLTYLPTPAFGDYSRALRAFHASVQLQCLSDFRDRLPLPDAAYPPDRPDHLASFAELASPTAGLLINNPHNPSGRLFSADTILPLLPQFGLVVIDEAFMDFLPPASQQSLIEAVEDYPNLVILRSLTKFYSLPGLRLGYAIAHPDRLRRWQQWRDPWSVNSLAAAAAIASLQDTAFQQKTWDWLTQARSQFSTGLSQLPHLFPLPSSANFLLVRCQTSATALQRQLLEQHQILIRDCLSFPELGDAYFRVAVRTNEENQRLLDGLAQVLSHQP